jgi:hypothetical protein
MLKEALKARVKGRPAIVRHLKSVKARVKASSWEGRIDKMAALQEARQEEREMGRIYHLAYCYKRGTPYEKVERNPRFEYGEKEGLAKAVSTYAGGWRDDEVRAWMGLPVKEKPKRTAAQVKASLAV